MGVAVGDLDLAVVNGRVTRGSLLKNPESPGYWDHYAEPNFLSENEGAGKFRNAGAQAPSFCSETENSRGLAFGDVDNDGDIDLLAANEGGRARLYRNKVSNKGHWLIVRAFDPGLKRDAIGAKIFVEWPAGNVEAFPGVAADQIITLQKGLGNRLERVPARGS